MNKSLINSILIKFKNMMFSTSIKITIIIGVALSIIISFFPFFSDVIFGDKQVKISTNLESSIFETMGVDYKLVGENEDEYDLKINFEESLFKLDIKTDRGYDNKNSIIQVINNYNLMKFLQGNNLNSVQLEEMINSNITINDIRENHAKVNPDTVIFLMYLTIIFYLVMVLLISRIGATVAFEKGNKVTEIILTSITKKQLYFSQVIASCMVIIINFIVISIPMVVAYIVNDPKITSNFDIFNLQKIILFLVHLITVSICLVISSIGVASMTKRIEEANVVSVFSLLPLVVSYLYYVIEHDLFRGVFYVLNYIPYFSAYPVFGAILSDTISVTDASAICFINIIFTFITYYIFRRVYCNQISID